MNKLSKTGLSALCGSLTAVSAVNAGELAVSGGADMSWLSNGGAVMGNPIGIGSNMTFSGSGELDMGWTYTLNIVHTNKAAYSATDLTMDMGSLGKINIDQGTGNGIKAFDDKMPTAWEEPWGAGLGTGIQLVSGIGGGGMDVAYTTPKILGTVLSVGYNRSGTTSANNDKGASGAGGESAKGIYDATIHINPTLGTDALSGLNLYAGASTTPYHGGHAASTNAHQGIGDRYEAVGAVTYAYGPISLGYMWGGENTGLRSSGSVDYYKNTAWGVAFNVNDDLSISYGEHDSRKGFGNQSSDENVSTHVESLQIAYSIGGASIRWAESEADNTYYSTAVGNDVDGRTISVSLAF